MWVYLIRYFVKFTENMNFVKLLSHLSLCLQNIQNGKLFPNHFVYKLSMFDLKNADTRQLISAFFYGCRDKIHGLKKVFSYVLTNLST